MLPTSTETEITAKTQWCGPTSRGFSDVPWFYLICCSEGHWFEQTELCCEIETKWELGVSGCALVFPASGKHVAGAPMAERQGGAGLVSARTSPRTRKSEGKEDGLLHKRTGSRALRVHCSRTFWPLCFFSILLFGKGQHVSGVKSADATYESLVCGGTELRARGAQERYPVKRSFFIQHCLPSSHLTWA